MEITTLSLFVYVLSTSSAFLHLVKQPSFQRKLTVLNDKHQLCGIG